MRTARLALPVGASRRLRPLRKPPAPTPGHHRTPKWRLRARLRRQGISITTSPTRVRLRPRFATARSCPRRGKRACAVFTGESVAEPWTRRARASVAFRRPSAADKIVSELRRERLRCIATREATGRSRRAKAGTSESSPRRVGCCRSCPGRSLDARREVTAPFEARWLPRSEASSDGAHAPSSSGGMTGRTGIPARTRE